jgi:hypothetical protein
VVRVGANDWLRFTGPSNANFGQINLLNGGEIEFTQALTNTSSGIIGGRGVLVATGGLTNNGTMQFSGDFTDIYGAVSNNNRITVTAGSTTTFYNNVSIGPVGSITVNQGCTVAFLGSLIGQSKITGPGLKDFEGPASGGPIATVVGDSIVGTPGLVNADYIREDNVQVFGRLNVTPNGTPANVSIINTLDIPGGKFDLTDNDLIVKATPLATISFFISSAYSAGTWSGTGLTSSSAGNASGGGHPTALGYATAAILGVGNFDGQNVTGSNVLVRYTYSGDANLDGVVNALDFNAVATDFGASGEQWFQGDFNYDGVINTLDFTQLATNFGQVLPSPAVGSVVPEPTCMWLILASAFTPRRRRKHLSNFPLSSFHF